jgi:hypothetical protein
MPHCPELSNPIIISMLEDKVFVTHLQFCEYPTSLTSSFLCTQQFAHSSTILGGIAPLPLVSSCRESHPIHLSPPSHSSSSSLYTHIYKVMMRYLCCVGRDPLYHSYPPLPLLLTSSSSQKIPEAVKFNLTLYLPCQSVKCQSLSCQSATTCWIPLLAFVLMRPNTYSIARSTGHTEGFCFSLGRVLEHSKSLWAHNLLEIRTGEGRDNSSEYKNALLTDAGCF